MIGVVLPVWGTRAGQAHASGGFPVPLRPLGSSVAIADLKGGGGRGGST